VIGVVQAAIHTSGSSSVVWAIDRPLSGLKNLEFMHFSLRRPPHYGIQFTRQDVVGSIQRTAP
jgi:hypothetical protein